MTMLAQLVLLALAFSVSSGTPTGLHFSNLDISETAVDTVVGSIECLDSESPTLFTLQNAGDVPFELSPVSDTSFATLFRTSELDYETGPDEYELQVTCADSSDSVSATATVNILPANEYLPVYSPDTLVISISEVTAAGTILASQSPGAVEHFTVSDQDRGEDGVLKFSFSQLTDDSIANTYFWINATDGSITLTRMIDVDIDYRSSVTLEVVACDGNRDENLCPIWIVDIVIGSVNEFTPQFSQPTYTTANQEYAEGDYQDELIATVSCTDEDTGVGELNSIELVEGLAPLQLVKVSDGQAEVLLSGSLDSEVIRAQELQVELNCSDTGSPPRTAIATLILHVKDLDDNLPEFTEPLYESNVDETLVVGSEVVAVVCTDKDYGAGDLADIRILNASSEVAQMFEVDSKTGSITLNKSLDFDAGAQSYQLTVVCRDSADNEVTARVNLNVLPVNDEQVRFTRSQYEFSVDRLKLPGEVVGKVETMDGDLDPQQVISYSIEDNPNFSIDDGGQVVLEDFILFLEGDHFRLSVTASDGANEEARSVVLVTVNGPLSVLDIVLIIAGDLLLLLAIVLLVGLIYCYKRWKKRQETCT
jgi:hypothetical protein